MDLKILERTSALAIAAATPSLISNVTRISRWSMQWNHSSRGSHDRSPRIHMDERGSSENLRRLHAGHKLVVRLFLFILRRWRWWRLGRSRFGFGGSVGDRSEFADQLRRC